MSTNLESQEVSVQLWPDLLIILIFQEKYSGTSSVLRCVLPVSSGLTNVSCCLLISVPVADP